MRYSFVVPQGPWVETYPTTNGRIIVAIRLAVAYVIQGFLLIDVRAFRTFELPGWAIDIYYALGVFIAAMAAFSLGQFWVKRGTADEKLIKATSDAKAAEIAAATGTYPATAATVISQPSAPALRDAIRVEGPSAVTARDIARRQSQAVEQLPSPAPPGADF